VSILGLNKAKPPTSSLISDLDEIVFYVRIWEQVCDDFPTHCGPSKAICRLRVAWSEEQTMSDCGTYLLCIRHAPAAIRAILDDDGTVVIENLPNTEFFDCYTCLLEWNNNRLQ
jgi:hypothetical protein